ncbi:MAG TPA: hypothetical protein PLW22_10415, partial [Tenuifilum sp.]|uniref:hypothetical protein n=1 Tax=Tenuifilum sp. TaxID=2760880 RepID=UPI002CF4501D|nr:hypothetical protein [Tenuifilum sp.]
SKRNLFDDRKAISTPEKKAENKIATAITSSCVPIFYYWFSIFFRLLLRKKYISKATAAITKNM